MGGELLVSRFRVRLSMSLLSLEVLPLLLDYKYTSAGCSSTEVQILKAEELRGSRALCQRRVTGTKVPALLVQKYKY
jgi:hypothetical protein